MTKGGDVMDPWSVALLALVGGFVGAWVAAAIFVRPSKSPVPSPPPPVPPPPQLVNQLPDHIRERLRRASARLAEAMATEDAARDERDAREALARAAAYGGGGAVATASAPAPPTGGTIPPVSPGSPRPGQAFFWTVPAGLPGEGGYFRLPAAVAAGGATEFRCPCGHLISALPPRRPGRGIRPDIVALEGHYVNCGTCQAAVHP